MPHYSLLRVVKFQAHGPDSPAGLTMAANRAWQGKYLNRPITCYLVDYAE
jgi:hypothetical protein